MFLHTIIPMEDVFDEPDDSPKMMEIVRGEMRLIVTPSGHARGRIVQVVSSNPTDFLREQFQPGLEIPLSASDFGDTAYGEGEET